MHTSLFFKDLQQTGGNVQLNRAYGAENGTAFAIVYVWFDVGPCSQQQQIVARSCPACLSSGTHMCSCVRLVSSAPLTAGETDDPPASMLSSSSQTADLTLADGVDEKMRGRRKGRRGQESGWRQVVVSSSHQRHPLLLTHTAPCVSHGRLFCRRT